MLLKLVFLEKVVAGYEFSNKFHTFFHFCSFSLIVPAIYEGLIISGSHDNWIIKK